MDNFRINVISDKREVFDMAIKIACIQEGPAKGWRVIPGKGLVFCWAVTEGNVTPLPTPLDAQGIADMAERMRQAYLDREELAELRKWQQEAVPILHEWWSEFHPCDGTAVCERLISEAWVDAN